MWPPGRQMTSVSSSLSASISLTTELPIIKDAFGWFVDDNWGPVFFSSVSWISKPLFVSFRDALSFSKFSNFFRMWPNSSEWASIICCMLVVRVSMLALTILMSDATDLQSKQGHTPVVSSGDIFRHFMWNHTPHTQHLIWSPQPLVRWRQLGIQDLGCEVSVDVPDTARGVAVFVVPCSVSTTAFVVVLSCRLECATSGSEDIFTMLRLDSMS